MTKRCLYEEQLLINDDGRLMKDNIILIGFMGVGKGRTARELSNKTGMFAVDCDDLIESLANMKVKRIFERFGEERFRSYEKAVANWLSTNVQDTIVSSGGGFLKVPNLKELGNIVYLHGEFDNIIDGIFNHPNAKKKIKKRPLLQNLEQARALYDQRLDMYKDAADLVVIVDNKETDLICDEIIGALSLSS